MACSVTQRSKVLAITHGFHGRTAAAGAVTWNSDKWYGFPQKPFEVDFIPRDDCAAAESMIGPDVAAIIVEPVQGVAGAFDLSAEFLHALSNSARQHGALLIADEVQSGMGRCGDYFAIQAHDIEPDLLTSAKSLGGGVPCAARRAARGCRDQRGHRRHRGRGPAGKRARARSADTGSLPDRPGYAHPGERPVARTRLRPARCGNT
jgi:acetylornithine/succinyldiaminopimelate/putrescine aminotransferase